MDSNTRNKLMVYFGGSLFVIISFIIMMSVAVFKNNSTMGAMFFAVFGLYFITIFLPILSRYRNKMTKDS